MLFISRIDFLNGANISLSTHFDIGNLAYSKVFISLPDEPYKRITNFVKVSQRNHKYVR